MKTLSGTPSPTWTTIQSAISLVVSLLQSARPQECVLMSHYHFFIQIINWKEFHPTNIPALALVGLFVVQSKDYRGLNWRNCSICLHFDSQSPVLEMIELITLSLGKLNNNVVRKGIKYLCFIPNQFKNPSLLKCRCWIAFFFIKMNFTIYNFLYFYFSHCSQCRF